MSIMRLIHLKVNFIVTRFFIRRTIHINTFYERTKDNVLQKLLIPN